MSKSYVFYNPLAGNGRCAEDIKALESIIKDEIVMCDMTKSTTYEETLFSMTAEDKLILCGGDGTLNRFINLTDGIDGLASSVAFTVGVSLFYFSAFSYPEVALSSAALVGATLGFLFFNINPAKIFMGDTGSLFLGALAVSMAFSLKNPFLIIPVCSVYVIEGISVILQVVFFKATGKRLFRMAPLHHHLERLGMSETKICMIAMTLTLATAFLTFFLLSL